MDRKIVLMGHMTTDLMVGTGQMEMTLSEMESSWILLLREAMDTGSILVLILTRTMIVIIIILTGGVIGDTFWMSLRRRFHLPLMEI